jgi:hypothetical protein
MLQTIHSTCQLVLDHCKDGELFYHRCLRGMSQKYLPVCEPAQWFLNYFLVRQRTLISDVQHHLLWFSCTNCTNRERRPHINISVNHFHLPTPTANTTFVSHLNCKFSVNTNTFLVFKNHYINPKQTTFKVFHLCVKVTSNYAVKSMASTRWLNEKVEGNH